MSDFDDRLSSPACAIRTADDAYMGYASVAELVAFLNELLAAARAGTRVVMRSRGEARQKETVSFLKQLARDGGSFSATLSRHVAELGGTVTSEVGSFYLAAIATPDMASRLAYLNREQERCVRRLKEMLPRIRDDKLYAALRKMLATHENNIAAAGTLIETSADGAAL